MIIEKLKLGMLTPTQSGFEILNHLILTIHNWLVSRFQAMQIISYRQNFIFLKKNYFNHQMLIKLFFVVKPDAVGKIDS